MEGIRIDKWLWAARFFKTRSLATDAVEAGRVRCAGQRIKPAHAVKPGAIYEIDNGSTRWEVEVVALADKRGSAAIAQTLYRETDDSVRQRERLAEERRYFHEPGEAIKGRPTKRDRRMLDRY